MGQRDGLVIIPFTIANTRRPLKDGYDDHGPNCVEYIALMIGPGTRLTQNSGHRPPRLCAEPHVAIRVTLACVTTRQSRWRKNLV